jgi:hypothetical protein
MQPLRGNLAPLTLASKAPILSWFLTGGISAANCKAAYAPKGATSQAASYTNLANPGTYTAAPGTAPAWDATNGWKFTAASSQYLTTGLTMTTDQTWSMIVRFAGVTGSGGYYICGAGNPYFALASRTNLNNVIYGNGNVLAVSPSMTSGVLAVVGNKGYRNGTIETGTIGTGSATSNALAIGAVQGVSVSGFLNGNIQALAIYNVNIAAYISALTTAINAL